MSMSTRDTPYELLRRDRCFALVQSVTGLRVEGPDVSGLIADMHRAMRDRRDMLAARDPGTLDPDERRDLDYLSSLSETFLGVGERFAEPLGSRDAEDSPRRPTGWTPALPYEMSRPRGGPCVLLDSVTGLRVEHRDLGVAIDRMHRLLLERRAALMDRDPDTLDANEKREFEHLRACPEQSLRAGLLSAGLVA